MYACMSKKETVQGHVSTAEELYTYVPALFQEKLTDEEILGFASFPLVENWNQACCVAGD